MFSLLFFPEPAYYWPHTENKDTATEITLTYTHSTHPHTASQTSYKPVLKQTPTQDTLSTLRGSTIKYQTNIQKLSEMWSK